MGFLSVNEYWIEYMNRAGALKNAPAFYVELFLILHKVFIFCVSMCEKESYVAGLR